MDRIRNLDIDIEKFHSKGFSFAHRMERIICFPPLWEGLKMTGPNVLTLRRSLWFLHPYAWWWKKFNGVSMLKDPRVNIDDRFAFDCIEPRLIRNWEFADIKLGEIKRKMFPYDNTTVPLTETLPYKYLLTRNPQIYKEYCDYNRKVWNNDLMSQERFDRLINSMETNGDTKKKISSY